MSSYVGRHAALYDLFYAAKDYAAEARFVDACLRRHAAGSVASVLELACGTGTHAFELEGMGHEVTALDHSEDMLAEARRKGAARGSRVAFHQADMRALALGRTFDAAVCLFDAIGYVATNDALAQVFQGVREHLRPGGLFLFEFWHAAALLRAYDPVRVRRFRAASSTIVRISETTLDCAKQLAHVAYTVHEHGDDGRYTSFEETQTNRYFLVQEMDRWLTTTGFSPVAWHSGFSAEEAITENTWHVVAVARRG